nr:MAG TPA_asm: hypothetical protein [Caudoviricetes sp.]
MWRGSTMRRLPTSSARARRSSWTCLVMSSPRRDSRLRRGSSWPAPRTATEPVSVVPSEFLCGARAGRLQTALHRTRIERAHVK